MNVNSLMHCIDVIWLCLYASFFTASGWDESSLAFRRDYASIQ